MEHHEPQQQAGVELSSQAPASLLANVMARLEQRQSYLSAEKSAQELVVALAHPQWEIRAAAVRSLGALRDQTSQDSLLAALHDEHRLVRAAAVRALGKPGLHVPLDALLIAMKDPSWEVREMVILTLSELGDRAPDPLRSLLLAAQQDTHRHVRDAAAFALSTYHSRAEALTPVVAPVETPLLLSAQQRSPLLRIVARYCTIFLRQIFLIHKSIWAGTVLLLLFWGLLYFHIPFMPLGDTRSASLYLALFTTISAAAGTAFIFGGERDAAFELTLSTPTSIRIIMFSRFLLVVGYNILLAACASALLAFFTGGGFWNTLQLWFGPMILLSSLTLTLSLLIGSWFAILAALVLEFSQTLVFNSQQHLLKFNLAISQHWQTNPMLLILAICLLVFAALYAPRQPRLAAI